MASLTERIIPMIALTVRSDKLINNQPADLYTPLTDSP